MKINKAEQKRQRLHGLLSIAQDRATQKRPTIFKPQYDWAIDWGDYKKGKLVGYNGREWRTFKKPLPEVIADLAKEGASSAVIEGSFGSFDLREVARVLSVAKEHDFVIGKIPAKQTERYRRTVLGLEEDDKSEQIDALCIFEIANHQSCMVAIAKPPSPEQIEKQQARRATPTGRALVLRSLGWPDAECAQFVKYFPAVVESWVKETYFYDAKKKKLKVGWCAPVVAAAIEVLKSGGGRDEFDRRIGYHAFGYGSYLRSNFYFGIVKPAVKARLGVRNSKELSLIDRAVVKQTENEESTKHRRVCRALFYNVKRLLAA